MSGREPSEAAKNPHSREPSGHAQVLEQFTPGGLMLLVALMALLAEGTGVLLTYFWGEEYEQGGMIVHLIEVGIILVSSFFLLYLPLNRRLEEKERSVQGLRENEHLLQRAMQEREQHLRLALEGTNSGLWDWDLIPGKAYYSPCGEKILGYQPGELDLSVPTWKKLLHPEDLDRVGQQLADHLEGRTPFFECEYRQHSKTGEWIWFHSLGRVTSRDPQGSPRRMIGIFNDISDRKLAEKEIHHLWQHLDRAGELERSRLARDLHDHFGQMVTVLQLELGGLKRALGQPEDIVRCQHLIDLTTQLGQDVRNVTARLRPPALDLGLVPALEYDLEFLRRHPHNLEATLKAQGLRQLRLDPESETTLFRIYQEALNNVVKHAGAKTVDIRLQRKGPEVLLTIQDDGAGFEVNPSGPAAKHRRGTGLAGMRERVAALGGRLEILSGPDRGTTIRAILPFRPQSPEAVA